ncbi:MAG: Hsp20/alpha crystallin family protein [Phycisphaerales bacterium]|nr:Hsp20/alpha crystallin family protein [Phycisphaerales bacterium]
MMTITNNNCSTAEPVRGLFNTMMNDVAKCCRTSAKGRLNLDILETEHAYEIRASLPGFHKDQVTIDLENNVLTLEALSEKTTDTDAEKTDCCGGEGTGKSMLRSERFSGDLGRTVRLPDNIDETGLAATLELGVLNIVLPKVPVPQSRRIDIA